MRTKFYNNMGKGGWDKDSVDVLRERVSEEIDEMDDAIMYGLPKSQVQEEAADVANYLMMVSDVY
jgi:NTP pyrophosphatase (non-canonical NTP hydrolase)